jgi:hypothetical protein
MVFKSVFGAICAYLAVASLNVSADVDVRQPQAVSFPGNTFQGDSPYTIGMPGMLSDASFPDHYEIMGSYNYDNVLIDTTESTTHFYADKQALKLDDSAGINWGSSLARDTTVPAPAAILLFGSILVGLAGTARRKIHVK